MHRRRRRRSVDIHYSSDSSDDAWEPRGVLSRRRQRLPFSAASFVCRTISSSIFRRKKKDSEKYVGA